MNRLKSAAAVIALLAATGARADTVQLAYVGNGPVLPTHVSIYNTDRHIYVGSYNIQQQGASSSFAAYCVDPFQSSSGSYFGYERSPLVESHLPVVSADRFGNVNKLFSNAYAGSLVANGEVSANTMAAGFNLALWEIWHDDGNLATGNIQTNVNSDAGMIDQANILLASLAGWNAGAPSLVYYSNTGVQDYIAVVPEPENYALLLAGLGMLGAIARRRLT